MATLKGIELGISAYSYTQQFVEREDFGIDAVVRHIAEKGVTKLELVGAQTFQQYPCPDSQEVRQVRTACDRHGVEVYSYGGYVDLGRITGYRMTDEDILADIRLDLLTARRLGAAYLRGSGFRPALVPRVAELADAFGIQIGYEVHAPHTPSDPVTREFIEVLDKHGITSVGLVPDFGMFIERPTEIAINRYLGLGARRELLDYVIANRHNGMSEEEMQDQVADMGGGEGEKVAISEWFGYLSFGPADLEGFTKMVPFTRYVHGKFYHVDEALDEPTIPYAAALGVLIDGGFEGVIMSEYEGHAFYLDDADEQLERYLELVKGILARP